MKSIYFYSEKEIIYFCEVFFRKYHEIQVQWKKRKNIGYELIWTNQQTTVGQLVPVFMDVFMRFRLGPMIREIAQKEYYYTLDAEMERICELTKMLLKIEGGNVPLLRQDKTLYQFLFHVFNEQLHQSQTIYFDAVLQFSLQPLKAYLVEMVGLGIDEMKREEEHQTFIQAVREYIAVRPSKQKLLYIVQGEIFTFYKSSGEVYSIWELKKLMRKEALYVLGLDEKEENIAPVITLLPEKIYLFGDNPEEPKTMTLYSMFQERLEILPAAAFPFHAKLN